MAYLHIDNLYKNQEILRFKECYAMEKIHGTSANISYNNKTLHLFPGGSNYNIFASNFDKDKLKEKIEKLGVDKITIYGETYGGKCQGMKDTYGDKLKFVAFEVKIGTKWLAVPQAEEIVKELGLEFVYYKKIPTTLEAIDIERDLPSEQAIRNGIGITKGIVDKQTIIFINEAKKREGIVLRPLMEVTKNNGERIIAKHKREDFRETKTKRKVTGPEKLKILEEANAVAEEWVTLMRLNHILGKIENPDITMMRGIIKTMVADVKREGDKEIIWSKSVEKAIGKKTANMTKEYFKNKLKEE